MVLGEDELARGEVAVKDMDTGEQQVGMFARVLFESISIYSNGEMPVCSSNLGCLLKRITPSQAVPLGAALLDEDVSGLAAMLRAKIEADGFMLPEAAI